MTGARGNAANRPMATPETEIIVEDPTAPSDSSPSVVSTRTVDIVVSLLLLALAALLCFDNWRTGIAWAPDGPQAGYFPFYLGLIRRGQSLRPHHRVGNGRRRDADIPHSRPAPASDASLHSHAGVLPAHAVARTLCRKFFPDRGLHADHWAHCALEVDAHRLPVRNHHVRHLRHCVRRHHAERPARSGFRLLG